jgi:hypothetical protein
MTSPYLEQPMRPLPDTLSSMLAKIESELTHETLEAAEKWRLRERAELVRDLLAPSPRGPVSIGLRT